MGASEIALYEVDYFSAHKFSFKTLQATRWLGFVSSLIWLIQTHTLPSDGFPNYVYMTIWGCFAAVVYFAVVLYITHFCKREQTSLEKLNQLERFTHLLFQTAFGLEFVIFLIYWLFLLPMMDQLIAKTPEYWLGIWLNCIGTHLLVPLHMVVEAILNRVCFHKRDGLVLIPTLGIVYSVLNYYWSQSYGKPIYPPMDWKTISTPIFLGAAFSFAGVGFYLGYQSWLFKLPKKTKKVE